MERYRAVINSKLYQKFWQYYIVYLGMLARNREDKFKVFIFVDLVDIYSTNSF